MRKGVKFRSSAEPIERRTSAPAPYDTISYANSRRGLANGKGNPPLRSLVREPS
jgi:hypothetical protein